MELRDIEIFLTLADELHFGRTAERLHLSGARVSQSIKKQERLIGAPLFERTSRRVVLTAVGEQLKDDLAIGYDAINDAVNRARASAHGVAGVLTVGTVGEQAAMIGEILADFQQRYPDAEIVQRDIKGPDPVALLLSGTVDVAHLWLPVRTPEVSVGPVTHTTNPWAGRDEQMGSFDVHWAFVWRTADETPLIRALVHDTDP